MLSIFFLIIFFLILSCMSCLYILEINPLSVASFANIFPILRVAFSSSICFHLLCKSFQVSLDPICFYFHCSRRWVKMNLLWFMSKSVLPMHPSKNFIVSGLTFRSLINFEFIFVYGVRKCSIFILFHDLPSFPSTIYRRGCLFSIVHSCLLYQR